MAVTDGFREFVLEQLQQAARGIASRRMFGAIGVYAGEHFFAVIADDRLYFKVDDQTRPAFEAAGMEPFRPYGPDYASIGYYEVPLGVLEAADDLRRWTRDAIAVAERARTKPRSRRR